jgi:membrane-bound ClpP family serine protease
VVGKVGTLVTATRGQAGPGEVWVRVRGGSERFLAWSDEPLPRGESVLIIDSRGSRTVDVVACDDTFGEIPKTPGPSQDNRSGE